MAFILSRGKRNISLLNNKTLLLTRVLIKPGILDISENRSKKLVQVLHSSSASFVYCSNDLTVFYFWNAFQSCSLKLTTDLVWNKKESLVTKALHDFECRQVVLLCKQEFRWINMGNQVSECCTKNKGPRFYYRTPGTYTLLKQYLLF